MRPFNLTGSLKGRNERSLGDRQVGIESYDSVDGLGKPIRRHRGSNQQHEPKPRRDGFDEDRLQAARARRDNRAMRNRTNKMRGGYR